MANGKTRLSSEEFQALLVTRGNFRDVRRFCLIGGGDLMCDAAEYLVRHGYGVTVVVAPRHVDEVLPILGGTLRDRLRMAGASTYCVDDINEMESWPVSAICGPDVMALCFGPAWIFSPPVVGAFGQGMINVNLIPVPKYLGGAHYTWQILNGDRSGGCYLQRITGQIDRGDILYSKKFEIPNTARIPRDYALANYEQGRGCIAEFLGAIEKKLTLAPVPYAEIEQDRLYFPRLLTVEQAYINWSWSAIQIERFCNAFDEPYDGAATFLGDKMIRVKDVVLVPDFVDFHPFAAGLIVSRANAAIIVAAAGGALRIGAAKYAEGNDASSALREGKRLTTPNDLLIKAMRYNARFTSKGLATDLKGI